MGLQNSFFSIGGCGRVLEDGVLFCTSRCDSSVQAAQGVQSVLYGQPFRWGLLRGQRGCENEPVVLQQGRADQKYFVLCMFDLKVDQCQLFRLNKFDAFFHLLSDCVGNERS